MAALGILNLDWSEVLVITAVAALFFGGSTAERILELLQRRRRH